MRPLKSIPLTEMIVWASVLQHYLRCSRRPGHSRRSATQSTQSVLLVRYRDFICRLGALVMILI